MMSAAPSHWILCPSLKNNSAVAPAHSIDMKPLTQCYTATQVPRSAYQTYQTCLCIYSKDAHNRQKCNIKRLDLNKDVSYSAQGVSSQ